MTSLSPNVTLSPKMISLSSHVTLMNSLLMPLCYKVTPPSLKVTPARQEMTTMRPRVISF